MTKRSYRWLLVLLAVVGLTADQFTKYNVFRWLYHQGPEQPTTDKDAAFVAWDRAAPAWVVGSAPGISGGRYDVIPGWFGFIAQYNPPARKLPDGAYKLELNAVGAVGGGLGVKAVSQLRDDELIALHVDATTRKPVQLKDDEIIVLHVDETTRKPIKPWRYDLQTASAPRMPHVNRGALFGMGANQDGSPDAEQQAENSNTLFAVISLIAAGGICVWGVLRGKRADAWICAALGMILGGTVGNLFDRVVFYGVRDFLFFYKIDWPVFNVADCCLVCGAIMLVLHAVFVKPPKPDAVVATTAAAAAPVTLPTPTVP